VKTLLWIPLLGALLTGCALSRDVRQADGWVVHEISCGGPFLNLGHCLEQAGETCFGRGYRVLNSEGGELPKDPNALPTGGLPDIPASTEQLGKWPKRRVLVRCN
jgi:hypothetical protein